MTSGGGPEGNCKQCGEYSQSRSIRFSGLCRACETKKTTPIKIPTQAELHVIQIYHLLEKMLAKEICKCER